jgi:DNA-binding transcriptional ArsR family regulator
MSSETRLSIVHRLATDSARVHELVEEPGLPQPLVSQHLRCCAALCRRVHVCVAGVASGGECRVSGRRRSAYWERICRMARTPASPPILNGLFNMRAGLHVSLRRRG